MKKSIYEILTEIEQSARKNGMQVTAFLYDSRFEEIPKCTNPE